MTRWTHIAVWLSLLVFATGCTCCCCGVPVGPAPDLTRQDLVGNWVSDSGSSIVFNSDGTFAATDLDRRKPPNWDGSLRSGGTGTWTLHDAESFYPYQDLDLTFDDGYQWFSWKADGEDVFFLMGDPDVGRRCLLSRSSS